MYYDKEVMKNWLQEIEILTENNPRWGEVFKNCFTNTLDRTIERINDSLCFVLTGDIPAMWLRDSSAQIKPYILLSKVDLQLRKTIIDVIAMQIQCIIHDPYANAFNISNNYKGHQDDNTSMSGRIWERKYEIDSLCYPINLSYLLWKKTGEVKQFNTDFFLAILKIVRLWKLEQNHENSSYIFERNTDRKEDTLVNNGRGPKCCYTGMTWSGFRPSDDACVFSYLISSNMFAVVVLKQLEEIIEYFYKLDDDDLKKDIADLYKDIEYGIKKYGVVKNKKGNDVYAYEVDGFGNFIIMDDANVPSLLSAPYLGYCSINDPIYLETRRTILSNENPYYYSGKFASGIGSSHTFVDYIWPIALSIEGLTTDSIEKKEEILNILVACDGSTGQMHESFYVNNPNYYSREWFSWANMMFCELVLDYYDSLGKLNER